MRNPKWMTPTDVADVVAAALMASAAACTVNHKETEVFLRHVATFITHAGGTSENSTEALAQIASILTASAPPQPMCEPAMTGHRH